MLIININNDYLLTHRYGWHKIMHELITCINSDIILVDFMDKYFNLWFELPKILSNFKTFVHVGSKIENSL